MSLFRRSKKRPSGPYLFDGPHWRIQPVDSLELFFAHVLALLPEGHALLLAEGSPTKEVRQVLGALAQRDGTERILPPEFRGAAALKLDEATVARLEDLSSREPCPVLAVHVCICSAAESLLEWYDLPLDPLSVAATVTEDRVARFARACGVKHEDRRQGTLPT